jgi:hypothetical protein
MRYKRQRLILNRAIDLGSEGEESHPSKIGKPTPKAWDHLRYAYQRRDGDKNCQDLVTGENTTPWFRCRTHLPKAEFEDLIIGKDQAGLDSYYPE